MSRIAPPLPRTSPPARENGFRHTLHDLRRSPRVAVALWLVLSFMVWNVVFDRILVLEGRRYSIAAIAAVLQGHAHVSIDEWMRPAIAHGVRTASLTALAIAAFGLVAVAIASKLDQRRRSADLE